MFNNSEASILYDSVSTLFDLIVFKQLNVSTELFYIFISCKEGAVPEIEPRISSSLRKHPTTRPNDRSVG